MIYSDYDYQHKYTNFYVPPFNTTYHDIVYLRFPRFFKNYDRRFNVTSDIYHKLFSFSFEYPNTDLLNVMSLYMYIISIEICVVFCVYLIHSFVINPEYPFYSVMNINRRGLFGVSSFFFLWSNSFSNLTLPMGIPSKLESYLDFFFLVLPTLIVLYILIPSLGLLYNKEFELDNLTYSFSIEVVGHQWYWSYQYKINTWELFDLNIIYIDQFDSILIADDFPRLLCVDNPLVIPTYTNILLIITSADVIHSWALPSAGIKVDAIPGRVASTNLFLFYEKYFFGQCSELCGANHGFMPIMIRSISRNLFFSYITNVDYSSLFDY